MPAYLAAILKPIKHAEFLNLLSTIGKRIRHIKIKDILDIKAPAVRDLISEARNMALELVDENLGSGQIIETIIKPISGIKK